MLHQRRTSIVLAVLLLAACVEANAQAPRIIRNERQDFSMMVGLGLNTVTGEPGFASGPTYRLRFGPRLAVGGAIEATSYEFETSILLLADAFVKTFRNLEVNAGPALRFIASTHREDEPPGLVDERAELAFRVGLGYRIDLADDYRILPRIAFDLGGKEPSILFGAAFGIPF